MSKLKIKDENFKAILFLLPSAILVGGFIISMVIYISYSSFFKWDIDLTIDKFVGLYNYFTIFGDKVFQQVLINNLTFLLAIPFIVFVPLIIAVLIFEGGRGSNFFKTVFLFPSVVSVVVVGIVFKAIFSYSGPINRLLDLLGLESLIINWLGIRETAIVVIVIAIVWVGFGKGVIIYLAALSSISPSILEAAEIDGASWFQKLFRVIIPMIIGVIEFYAVLAIIGIFTTLFGYIYIMTRGGPGYGTSVLEYFIYRMTFSPGRMGFAAAMTVVAFIMMFVITSILMKIISRRSSWRE